MRLEVEDSILSADVIATHLIPLLKDEVFKNRSQEWKDFLINGNDADAQEDFNFPLRIAVLQYLGLISASSLNEDNEQLIIQKEYLEGAFLFIQRFCLNNLNMHCFILPDRENSRILRFINSDIAENYMKQCGYLGLTPNNYTVSTLIPQLLAETEKNTPILRNVLLFEEMEIVAPQGLIDRINIILQGLIFLSCLSFLTIIGILFKSVVSHKGMSTLSLVPFSLCLGFTVLLCNLRFLHDLRIGKRADNQLYATFLRIMARLIGTENQETKCLINFFKNVRNVHASEREETIAINMHHRRNIALSDETTPLLP